MIGVTANSHIREVLVKFVFLIIYYSGNVLDSLDFKKLNIKEILIHVM